MSDNPPAAKSDGGDPGIPPRPPGTKDVGYDDPEATRFFGCPFYKHDPVQHINCMMRQTLTHTNYVKQHLRRYHLQPIHCPTCGEIFQQLSKRDAHIRESTCARREFKIEGINSIQQEALNRKRRNSRKEDTWYQIWDILFPGEPRPESPYVDDAFEEIGRLYLKQLNQQQPGTTPTVAPAVHWSQVPEGHDALPKGWRKLDQGYRPEVHAQMATAQVLGSDAVAHTETHREIPRVVPDRQAGPSLGHSWDAVTFTSARQPGSSLESGLRMEPERPGHGFISRPQVDPQSLHNDRGYQIHPNTESWHALHEDGRRVLDANATLQAPTEDPQVQVPPSTNPYPVIPSFHVGDQPEHDINTPEFLKTLEGPTVGDTKVGGASPTGETPGLTTPKGLPPPHPLKPELDVHEAGFSEDGGNSCQDSGYVSRETRDKAEEDNVDDGSSIYSTDSISLESRSRYITTFTNRLAQDICQLARVSTIPEGSRELLLEWVRTFALKLQGESTTRTRREASIFIRKYRRDVVEELAWLPLGQSAEKCTDHDEEENPRQPFNKPQETIGEWLGGLNAQADPETSSVMSEDEDEKPLPNIEEYEKFIPESDAYKWLLSKIECHTQLAVPDGDTPADIGDYIRTQILSQQSLRNVSRRAPPPRIELSFSLDWNPLEFIKSQEYSLSPTEAFDHIICLTGTWKQAQAMTVAEYMEQTWPLTNKPLRNLLKHVLRTTKGGNETLTVQDSSMLRYTQFHPFSCVTAKGQLDFVSEIAEQLAWLASTLRPSPVSSGVLACTPKILSFKIDEEIARNREGISIFALCKLSFPMAIAQEISTFTPGFCWANLFRNPLLVTGYPIRRRVTPDTGLEVSLGVMTELVQSRQLIGFGEKVILKGFCSLLVATAVLADAVTWHLFFNSSGERISYCDPRVERVAYKKPKDFVLREFESRRHIVGWWSDVREYTGCAVANYAIKSSNLPPPPASMGIKTIYIEGGASAVGGAMIMLGVKDKPVHMSRGSRFTDLLAWVAEQPMVLYDSGDRRAWLVDGASALLHLVRASMERDRNNPAYRSKWRFDGILQGDSAIEILADLDNLDIKLFVDYRKPTDRGEMEDVYCYFRDRVEDILRNLDTLIDYQVQAAARNGYWVHQSGPIIKKTVVGFDFWDVAKPAPSIPRRYHGLDTWGYGWVDYIRTIGVTVIFGNDLGELIRTETEGPCPGWASVRTGQDLMCTSIRTLKTIHATMGTCLGPGELTSDMFWSSRCPLFAKCPCLSLHPGGAPSHVDPVQLLLPKKRIGKLRLDVPTSCVKVTLADLQDLGAVVFGHTPYHKTQRGLKYEKSSGKDRSPVSTQSRSSSSVSRVATSDLGGTGLESSTELTSPPMSSVGSRDKSSEDVRVSKETRVTTPKDTPAWLGTDWFRGLRFRR